MTRFVLALACLGALGCSNTKALLEEGGEFEEQAYVALQAKDYPSAAKLFTKSAEKYGASIKASIEDEVTTVEDYLQVKYAGVLQEAAKARQPETTGAWEECVDLYARSAAASGRFLKLRRNAIRGQADCTRPDRNPKGTWPAAAKLYAEAASLSVKFEEVEGQREALRLQAICVLEGKTSPLTKAAKTLLIKAKGLGDQPAAKLLVQVGSRFCSGCGETLSKTTKFCPSCGTRWLSPAERAKAREEEEKKRSLKRAKEKVPTPLGRPKGSSSIPGVSSSR